MIGNCKSFCRDGELHLVENYHEAVNSDEKWVLHHRLEFTVNGEFSLRAKDLKRFAMYYNRPHFELISLLDKVHKSMHALGSGNSMYGKPSANLGITPSDETRLKRSRSLMRHEVSKETRIKLSLKKIGVPNIAARKPKTEEHKLKLSIANKGKKRSPESIEKQKLSARLYFQNRRLKNGNAQKEKI